MLYERHLALAAQPPPPLPPPHGADDTRVAADDNDNRDGAAADEAFETDSDVDADAAFSVAGEGGDADDDVDATMSRWLDIARERRLDALTGTGPVPPPRAAGEPSDQSWLLDSESTVTTASGAAESASDGDNIDGGYAQGIPS